MELKNNTFFFISIILFFISLKISIITVAESIDDPATRNHIFLTDQYEKKLISYAHTLWQKKFLEDISQDVYKTRMYSGGKTTKDFLQQRIIVSGAISNNEKTLDNIQNIIRFSEIDVWEYLENKPNRTKSLAEYQQRGEQMLQEGKNLADFFETKKNRYKTEYSGLKTQKKDEEEKYSNFLENSQTREMEKTKETIKSIALKMTEYELEHKKYNHWSKSINTPLKAIEKKISASYENEKALILKVQTKENSGKSVGVIKP